MEMTNEKFETEMTSEKIDAPVYFCIDFVNGVPYYCRFWEDCVRRPIFTYDDIYSSYSPTQIWDELVYAECILEFFSKIEEYSKYYEDIDEVRWEKFFSLLNVIGWRNDRSDYAWRLISEIGNSNAPQEIINELRYLVYESLYEKSIGRQKSKIVCLSKEQRFNPADALGSDLGVTELASILEMVEEYGFCFGYDADSIEVEVSRMEDNEDALRMVKMMREGIEDKAEAKRVADELWRFFYGEIPRPKDVRLYKFIDDEDE